MQNQPKLEQFDLLTASAGWVLLGQQLFWTSDAGQTWQEMGPTIDGENPQVQAVKFSDPNTGWVLWTTVQADGGNAFQLAHTVDGGGTWSTRTLQLFEPGETASYAEKVEMGWFDSQTGWIAVKESTSSNFSMATLFTTRDGGESWQRVTLPVAGSTHFRDPQTGWVVGGPANDQVFVTQDGGAHWTDVTPLDAEAHEQSTLHPAGHGVLVRTTVGLEPALEAYSWDVPGEWLPLGELALAAEPGRLALSILDPENLVAVVPGTNSIVHMRGGKLALLDNSDAQSGFIIELDMVSMELGWAKSVEAECRTDSRGAGQASVSCSSTTRLLQTADGGLSWQSVNLPLLQSGAASVQSMSSERTTLGPFAAALNTVTFIGQGFDRCQIPTLAQMQTWADSSPYGAVNLYIGGSSRACANSVLTSSYLFQLYQQGWRFIPTWVGPQAPCTGYPNRMSGDPAISYTQGVDEANLAIDRLAALGLTGPDKTGSVVYYDIEHYGTNIACRSAVNAFMNGWVSQLKARGHVAGVYGSTLCNTGISDFRSIANIPDVIWPARWYHSQGAGYYDPEATVWDLGSCIPNSDWANHQRIRQYEGDHYETWGGLTLDIDSNVLDGVVAFPYDYPQVSRILLADASPAGPGIVDFTVTFSKIVTGVIKNDFVLVTKGVKGASISTVSGSGATYTVSVNTGSGAGVIRLDVVDDDSIRDAGNNPLGGAGTGNGSLSYGERYTIVIGADTTGVFRPSNGALYLKNSNVSGFADVQINYGLAGDYPVVGDWDGDGDATIGIYRDGQFYLRQSNTIGVADLVIPFGAPGDQPVAGDWNGDGIDTIGIYRNGVFLLRNSNTPGAPEMTFGLGVAGDVGIAGDWDGDGVDSTGVFRPSNGALYLKNTNATGFADIQINYGLPGDKPVTGDWNNDGIDTIGIYRNGTFHLRNTNTIGVADVVFGLGIEGDHPIAGNWDGKP